ncbi:MAG: hypothetical protein HC921_06495 [Synechococcaceae cyanobacterium SM2_3_1]|nr:hypothetical protein [Synechococcaceae cyanobacterium SM2_3_1]
MSPSSAPILLLKLLLLSLGLSFTLKQGGPLLALPAATPTLLILICLPGLGVALILFWLTQRSRESHQEGD